MIRDGVGRREFQGLVDLSDSVPISPPSLSSAIRNDLMRIMNEAELAFEPVDGEKNYDEFLSALQLAEPSDLASSNPGEMSLLQRAADIGIWRHVQALLSKGADPNWAASGTAPALVLAAKCGHADVIRVLKEHKINKEDDPTTRTCDFAVIDTNSKSSVLHSVLRKPFGDYGMMMPPAASTSFDAAAGGATAEERYTACLRLILDDVSPSMDAEIRKVINGLDEMGNTPLHYATQMWPQAVVRMLLERGANIGMKNVYDEVPIESILPETMEAFLDEFCLTSEGDLTNRDFKVTARYDFLAPPRDFDGEDANIIGSAGIRRKEGWKSNGVGNDEEAGASKQKPEESGPQAKIPPLPETDVLWYMSQSKKHRHLLKHPVITSFLWLKWQRISSAYSKNLAFYLGFVVSLTAYIFIVYGGKAIRSVSVLKETCSGNATVDAAVLALPTEVTVFWHINTVLLVVLGLRELLQFSIAPRRYFFSIENWLELTLIVLISLLLFMGGYGCNVSAKRHIAAVVIVLSWSELITMIGRHPKLSTYNIYVTMFYKVTSTFILFLIW